MHLAGPNLRGLCNRAHGITQLSCSISLPLFHSPSAAGSARQIRAVQDPLDQGSARPINCTVVVEAARGSRHRRRRNVRRRCPCHNPAQPSSMNTNCSQKDSNLASQNPMPSLFLSAFSQQSRFASLHLIGTPPHSVNFGVFDGQHYNASFTAADVGLSAGSSRRWRPCQSVASFRLSVWPFDSQEGEDILTIVSTLSTCRQLVRGPRSLREEGPRDCLDIRVHGGCDVDNHAQADCTVEWQPVGAATVN